MFKHFNEYKNNIISEIGIEPMYDDQIKKYGKVHFNNFGGVYPHDKLKPQNYKCYVVNTGNSNSAGYHWIGIYVTPNNFYVFDSYHRDIHSIVKDAEKIKGNRNIIVSKWTQPIQKDTDQKQENICGQLSLAWLHCVKDYGIRNAILI